MTARIARTRAACKPAARFVERRTRRAPAGAHLHGNEHIAEREVTLGKPREQRARAKDRVTWRSDRLERVAARVAKQRVVPGGQTSCVEAHASGEGLCQVQASHAGEQVRAQRERERAIGAALEHRDGTRAARAELDVARWRRSVTVARVRGARARLVVRLAGVVEPRDAHVFAV